MTRSAESVYKSNFTRTSRLNNRKNWEKNKQYVRSIAKHDERTGLILFFVHNSNWYSTNYAQQIKSLESIVIQDTLAYRTILFLYNNKLFTLPIRIYMYTAIYHLGIKKYTIYYSKNKWTSVVKIWPTQSSINQILCRQNWEYYRELHSKTTTTATSALSLLITDSDTITHMRRTKTLQVTTLFATSVQLCFNH